jgi:hypothetical protein
VYGDDLWKVCHAPASMRPAVGQLMVEATRHFLDYSEMTDEEAAQIGPLMRRLYAALRSVTGAERVYSVVLLEGVPHFHLHLVPRPADAPQRGLAHLQALPETSDAEIASAVALLGRELERQGPARAAPG